MYQILIIFIKTNELVKDICILTRIWCKKKHNYYLHTINTQIKKKPLQLYMCICYLNNCSRYGYFLGECCKTWNQKGFNKGFIMAT
jgi:hypothetical protein